MTQRHYIARILRLSVAFFFPLAIAACSGAPDCNAGKTKELLEHAMSKQAIDSIWGEDFRQAARYSVRNIRKLAYDKESDTYTCAAVMVVAPKDSGSFDFREVESEISYSVFSFQDDKSKFEIEYSGVKEGLRNGFDSFARSPAARRLVATRAEEQARQAKEFLQNEQEADAGVVVGACVAPRRMEKTNHGLSHATVYDSYTSSYSIGSIVDPTAAMLVRDRQGIYAQRAYVEGVGVGSTSFDSGGVIKLSDTRVVDGWVKIKDLRAVDSSLCASLPPVKISSGAECVTLANTNIGADKMLQLMRPVKVYKARQDTESAGLLTQPAVLYVSQRDAGRSQIEVAPETDEGNGVGHVIGWVDSNELREIGDHNCTGELPPIAR